jgi:hypothetical protein
MTTARRAAVLLLALASVGAGVIHLVFGPEHLEEWAPLGIGFFAAGALQVSWGGALAAGGSRTLLRVGAWGSLAFVAVYLMSRTTGLPLGPEAFAPEAFGPADLLCCAMEVPVAIGAFLLARRPDALRRPLTRRLAVVLAGAAIAMGSATSVAVASPVHEHEQHECGSAPVLTGELDARGVDTGVTDYFRCQLQHEHDHPGA